MEEIATPKLTSEFIQNLKLLNQFTSENSLHDVRNLISENLPDMSYKIERENSLVCILNIIVLNSSKNFLE